ncbi:MAG: HIT family protein [Candidatus Magasanikbacteria bacterium]|nr:HIT family protein [Candidatus Magasanikbacteria bacterium]
MNECLLCKISKGEIPSYKIYEDENSLAFLDIEPHSKGHIMVIPKKHAVTILELDEESMKNLFASVKKVTEIIKEKLNPDGFNIGWNHGEAGGQVLQHLHVHIMPRYNGDGGKSMHAIVNNPGELSVEEVHKLF